MPTLEALICRIVKESKRSTGEMEVSKVDTYDKARGHSKPHGRSLRQEAWSNKKDGKKSLSSEKMPKEVSLIAPKLPYPQRLNWKEDLILQNFVETIKEEKINSLC